MPSMLRLLPQRLRQPRLNMHLLFAFRWLRQVLESAAAADTFSLLDVNIHMTKAVSRSASFLSLQEVGRLRSCS